MFEALLPFADKHYNFSASHSGGNFTKDITKAVWIPMGGCPMPPQQPFYLQGSLALLQAFLIKLFFGAVHFSEWDKSVENWRWVVLFMTVVYQAGTFLLSLALCFRKFSEQGPFASIWQQYECLGLMLVTGPWLMNLLSMSVQLFLTKNLLRQAQVLAQSAPNWESRWRDGRAMVTERKLQCMKVLVGGYIVTFGIALAPYMATHIIPGIGIFFPITLLVLFIGSSISYLWNLRRLLANVTLSNSLINDIDQHSDDEEALEDLKGDPSCRLTSTFRFGLLTLFPVLIAVRVTVETAFLQNLCLQDGSDWVTCILVTWSERRISVYLENVRQVLCEAWTISQLFDAAF